MQVDVHTDGGASVVEPFMSSAGLGSMLLIYREAKAKDARVVLAEVNKDTRNSMSATGFLSFFTLRDSVQEGMQAVAAS